MDTNLVKQGLTEGCLDDEKRDFFMQEDLFLASMLVQVVTKTHGLLPM